MALLNHKKGIIFIGLNDKIALFDLSSNDLVVTTIAKDLPISGNKLQSDNEGDELDDKKDNGRTNPEPIEKFKVNNLAVAADYLAVTTNEKSLLVYDITSRVPRFVSRRRINRIATALKFSPDNRDIVVTDRTGDVYAFGCSSLENGKWLFGHMSQTLDILFSSNQKLIVTCDRDEKIRVTNYPETHDIATFCLGHREFVAGIEFMAPELPYLVSVSGDETVRIWDFVTGEALHKIQLTKPGVGVKLKQLSQTEFLVAVSLYDPPISANIAIYKVDLVADRSFKSNVVHEQQFDMLNLTSMTFCDDNRLALAFATANNKLAIKILKCGTDNAYVECADEEVEKFNKTLSTSELSDCKVEYVDETVKLYKKKFDNLAKYQERKKRRLEQQNNKD